MTWTNSGANKVKVYYRKETDLSALLAAPGKRQQDGHIIDRIAFNKGYISFAWHPKGMSLTMQDKVSGQGGVYLGAGMSLHTSQMCLATLCVALGKEILLGKHYNQGTLKLRVSSQIHSHLCLYRSDLFVHMHPTF